MKRQKGFTLIELLVVIAIIGILATVVMVSLNSARGKGANASVKANLRNVMTQAELKYDTDGGTYAAVCAETTIAKALDAASSAGAGNTNSDVCNNSAGAWAASAPLKSAEAAQALASSLQTSESGLPAPALEAASKALAIVVSAQTAA